MRELKAGVWHWEAPHPDWEPGHGWDEMVSSYQDLMDRFGITAEEAGEGSPDVAWLRNNDAVESHFVSVGERLSIGVETLPGISRNDHVLWVESHRVLVTGDSVIDGGQGLEIPVGWLSGGDTREQVVERLRPLLELSVEFVLATHGGPTDRAALERALS